MVEQQTWTSKQNLVVKEDVWIEIEPGQTGNFLSRLLRQLKRWQPQRRAHELDTLCLPRHGEQLP